MTDLHFADKDAKDGRFYREALHKLDEAVTLLNEVKPDLVVELGDFIDQAPSVEQELEWLKTMESHFAKLTMPRHYVLGNHCVGTLNKKEFADHTGWTGSFESFEANGVTFLCLDACFRSDGVAYERGIFHWKDCILPDHEISWFQEQLKKASGPVIVLTHQRMDHDTAHAIHNAPAVREIMEQSGKVLAVFQGHSHENDYQQIQGIHYTTLVSMIEGSGEEKSGYSLLEVLPDSSLRLRGFRRQEHRYLRRA